MHCAALSNRSLMAHSTGDYFLDDAALRELLNSGTQAELEALMTNPQLPASSMLPAIIHRRTFAEVLSEDRWYELIFIHSVINNVVYICYTNGVSMVDGRFRYEEAGN